MPCTTNSAHAQHTFLRGCCQSSCPCPGVASYQAGRYCDCNDTVQNQTSTYREELCRILGTLGITYTSNAAFQTAITAAGRFSSVRCGTFEILVGGTLEGTVRNGVYTTAGAPALTTGTYLVHIDSTTSTSCGTITIQ
jgi:hypothetical protein